jgi:hypothetical protein
MEVKDIIEQLDSILLGIYYLFLRLLLYSISDTKLTCVFFRLISSKGLVVQEFALLDIGIYYHKIKEPFPTSCRFFLHC